MRRIPVWMGLGVGLFGAIFTACAGPEDATVERESGDVVTTELAIASVPSGVQCVKVVVTVAGQTLTLPLMTVAAGSSSASWALGVLPAGAATFQGSAFNVACASVTSTTAANWIADAASASLMPGYVTTVPMNFKQNNPVTVNANFSGNVVEVTAGVTGTYARMGDGTVTQWGYNGVATFLTPTAVPSLTNVVEVVSGNQFACARKTDATVWCWGYNTNGVLGPNVALNASVSTPVQVTLPGYDKATRIAAGYSHMCAVASGSLYCWGNNTSGQLGNGNTTSSSSPLYIRSFASNVIAGRDHTCMSDQDGGYVYCVGGNSYGQLGNGSTTNSLSWVNAGMFPVAGMAAGGNHTCLIVTDSTLRCFGSNAYGQLGDGSVVSRSVPTATVGAANIVQVQAGQFHTCALNQSGAVSCWGQASSIGAGTAASSSQSTPATIPGLTGVTAVHASGGMHTCAELLDHSVKCWGANGGGQIGDGTREFVLRPKSILF